MGLEQNITVNVVFCRGNILTRGCHETVIGKMRYCGMRKVKCGIQKCGKAKIETT